jgi:hypothetical protein
MTKFNTYYDWGMRFYLSLAGLLDECGRDFECPSYVTGLSSLFLMRPPVYSPGAKYPPACGRGWFKNALPFGSRLNNSSPYLSQVDG